MGWFDSDSSEAQSYDTVYNNTPEEHKAKLSHELISGAAAFEAAKAYEDHVQKNGQPENHAMAKELLAGLAGVIIDREVETRGLDFIDKERAKHDACNRLHERVADDY